MRKNRHPVHLKPVAGHGKREQIWAQIRVLRTSFSINDLFFRLKDVSRDAIRSYVNSLVAADHLTPVTNDNPIRFTLVNDCGVDAPRVRLDGSIVLLGQGNANMWRTMRILKTFDWQDVMIAASTEAVEISKRTARSYIEMLHKAGYLRCVVPGAPGSKAIYHFNPGKWTGAQPPVIQRGGQLYDPNLGKVVYQGVNKTRQVSKPSQVLSGGDHE